MSGDAIIVSGATGFLGGAVARRLLGQNVPVIALGRNLPALGALEAIGARVFATDLAEGGPPPGQSARAFLHCAALSSPWGALRAFRRANVTATATALAWARETGAGRFVHISTPSLYFRFRDQRDIDERTPLPAPVNAYARTKGEAEALVSAASDLDTIILRPRGLYGAGDSALLPRLASAASRGPLPQLRGGCAETDLTHIDDAVEAVIAALFAPPNVRGRVFNISGGHPLRLTTVVEAACGRLGVPVRWRPMSARLLFGAAALMEAIAARRPGRPEPAITVYGAGVLAYSQTLDISAAAHTLGWRPQIDFAEGLARTFTGSR